MDRTLSDYCEPPRRQVALARVKREKHIPTISEIQTLLASMSTKTVCQRRDRAVVALLVLTGVRDGALVSLRLKHIDLENRRVFQDAKEVNTKASKTIPVFWFPVDEEFQNIVVEWVLERRAVATSEEEPLFPRSPSALPGHTPEDCFWATAAPVRKILKTATMKAGMTYFMPTQFAPHWLGSLIRSHVPGRNVRRSVKTLATNIFARRKNTTGSWIWIGNANS